MASSNEIAAGMPAAVGSSGFIIPTIETERTMEIPLTRIFKTPQRIRRYRDILTVFARYGLADWLNRLPLGFAREALARRMGRERLDESTERRIRKALSDLGPTFVKLGQLLSVRPDIVGVKLSEELRTLQDRVPPEPAETVRKVITDEFGRPPEVLFRSMDTEPVAAASIAQVHRAVLHSGEEAAVKVQRRGIEKIVEVDLDILADLADLMERHVPESRVYRPKKLVEEFSKAVLKEMDFRREFHHMETFRNSFRDDPWLRIPQAYPDLTGRRVLTMEFLRGVKVTDLDTATGYEKIAGDADRKRITAEAARIFLTMVLEHGLFHGDPHPGNVLITEEGRIGLLDFGLVGRLDDELREVMEDLLLGIVFMDVRKITHTFIRIGMVPHNLDRMGFQRDLQEFLGYYAEAPLEKIDIAVAVQEMLEVIRKHYMVLPADLALLAKVIITMDGTGRRMDPQFRIMDQVLPYKDRIIMRRLSPMRQVKKLRWIYEDLERLIQTVPASVSEVIRQVEGGRLTLQLQVPHVEEAARRSERASNRMTFAIVMSVLIVCSTALLILNAPPLGWGLSLPGVFGLGISFLMGVKLLWAISRSGGLQ